MRACARDDEHRFGERASNGTGEGRDGGGSGGGRGRNGGDEGRSDERRDTITIRAMGELFQSVGGWRTGLNLKRKSMEEATYSLIHLNSQFRCIKNIDIIK